MKFEDILKSVDKLPTPNSKLQTPNKKDMSKQLPTTNFQLQTSKQ